MKLNDWELKVLLEVVTKVNFPGEHSERISELKQKLKTLMEGATKDDTDKQNPV